MSEINFEIKSKRYRFTVRFGHIILPFNGGMLMSSFAHADLGYVLPSPPQGSGSIETFDAAGPIAQKGDVMIDFEPTTQVIGVTGLDEMNTSNVFSEILDIIKTTITLTMEEKIMFYELFVNLTIKTGQNPLELLGKLKFENGINEKISSALGEETTNYGIHVCSSGIVIDDSNWHDINIHPFPRSPDTTFSVAAVYRKSKLEQVIKFGNNFEENIKKFFETIN